MRSLNQTSISTTISILGSGWLGLPLAIELQQVGYKTKASTRSPERLPQLENSNLNAFMYDIESANKNDDFLQADILLINITSKNIAAFENLITEIESSSISKVLFISSTSVYSDSSNAGSSAISEIDIGTLKSCPLLTIENLFRNNPNFDTSIIRFAGLIGYQRHPGRFFAQKSDNGSITSKLIKNPKGQVNMIHRDDCIGIIKTMIEANTWGEIYNGCASHHPSRREFYSAALKHSHNVKAIFEEDGNESYKRISNQKVKEKLNYVFKYDDLLDFKSTPYL